MGRNALEETLDRIEEEPIATGEPAESVQIGRLQVVDEIRQLLKSGDLMVVEGWRSITNELPPMYKDVLFVNNVYGEWSEPDVGRWTGERTIQKNALVMDYGADDDWSPCTHWMPIPPILRGVCRGVSPKWRDRWRDERRMSGEN